MRKATSATPARQLVETIHVLAENLRTSVTENVTAACLLKINKG